ncbi:MAG: glycosyltransferase [Bacteroidia bacterium]
MLLTLKNRFQFFGSVLIGIGFVYQEATPFFLSSGCILLFLSAFLPPFLWKKDYWAIGILAIWLFNLVSGSQSENLGNWGTIVFRQLALVFLPVAVWGGLTLSSEQKQKSDRIWIGLSAVFALISLIRYFLHKEAVDLSLLESGAIPIWDGVSWPWKLDPLNSSKFVQDGISHIYFSLIQALAILVCWNYWKISKKRIWLVFGIFHLLTIHWFLARTGLLALYFAAGLLFFYYLFTGPNKKWLIVLAVVGLLLPLTSYFAFDAVRNKVQNSLEDIEAVKGERSINHRSFAMRVEAWKTAWMLIKKHPLGVGAGDVDAAMAQQYEANHTMLWPENRIPPHNQYLETALASGILASLLLLGLLLGGIWSSWRARNSLMLGIFSCLLIALCFESILQTQLGIAIFPFALLFLNPFRFRVAVPEVYEEIPYITAMKFSVVIITHNEAHRVEELLKKIPDVDEILVVDSFSTDGTAALCEKYGARVIQQHFLGFGQQKQLGVDAAKNDWIFSLDADEIPDEKCWEHIASLMREEPSVKGWYLKRHLVFMGRSFHYGKESRDKQLRFFDRRQMGWNAASVHESIEYQGKKAVLEGTVAHKSYDSLDNYFGKFNRYTSLAAEDLVRRKKYKSVFSNMAGVPFNFIKIYFLQLNFLNGYPGYCWSVFSSMYSLVKYSKAKERNKPDN